MMSTKSLLFARTLMNVQGGVSRGSLPQLFYSEDGGKSMTYKMTQFSSSGGESPSSPPSVSMDTIQDVDDNSLMALLQSSPIPVVLDCYADWCGPCKQLTPALEAGAKARAGKLILAKLDVDKHTAIAGQLGVSSIPAVFAIHAGRVVKSFVGAKSPEEVTGFLDEVLAAVGEAPAEENPLSRNGEGAQSMSPQDMITAGEGALKRGALEEAAGMFSKVMNDKDSGLIAEGAAGLAQVAIAEGKLDAAKAVLDAVTSGADDKNAGVTAAGTAAVRKARALLGIAVDRAAGGDGASRGVAEIQAALAGAEGDAQLELKHELSLAQFAEGDPESAINTAIEIVKADREWNDQAGRKALLKFFEIMGPGDPLTVAGTKRLSNVWFI